MFARSAFFLCLFAAAPGMSWQAFEMYGLTLSGPQMLFFSIVHTMPMALIVVMLAGPFMLAVFLQSALALGRPDIRERMGISKPALLAVVIYFPMHALFLGSYDVWSVTPFRIPLCVLGIALFGAALIAVATGSRRSRKDETGALDVST